jgi:hypothetical protein
MDQRSSPSTTLTRLEGNQNLYSSPATDDGTTMCSVRLKHSGSVPLTTRQPMIKRGVGLADAALARTRAVKRLQSAGLPEFF